MRGMFELLPLSSKLSPMYILADILYELVPFLKLDLPPLNI